MIGGRVALRWLFYSEMSEFKIELDVDNLQESKISDPLFAGECE